MEFQGLRGDKMVEDYYCRNCKNIFQPINYEYQTVGGFISKELAVCPICGSTATEPSEEKKEINGLSSFIDVITKEVFKDKEDEKCPACGGFMDEERPGYWHCKRCDFARWDINDTHPIMRYGRKE